MERNCEYRGIGDTVRILSIAVAALLVSAPVSAGPKDDERAALCSDALTADYGATEFGVSVQALIVGFDVGVDPLEILDLVTGFVFIDLTGDDF